MLDSELERLEQLELEDERLRKRDLEVEGE